MAALRKPELEPSDKKLPLLLVINREIQSTRRQGRAALIVKLLMLCAGLPAFLYLAHGIVCR